MVQPAQVDDQFDLAARSGGLVDAPGDLEPGGAPGGAPLSTDLEWLKIHGTGADTTNRIGRWFRLSGIGAGTQRAVCQCLVYVRLDALLHHTVATAKLLIGHQEHR